MVCAVNKEIIPLQVQFFNNFMKNKPELTEGIHLFTYLYIYLICLSIYLLTYTSI